MNLNKSLSQFALGFVITFVLTTAAQGGGVFTPTGSPSFGRNNHAAILLPSGKVLVAGGVGFYTNSDGDIAAGLITSTELFDPATGTWSPTGSLGDARAGHATTLLPNGEVLVAGGSGTTGGYFFGLWSAELYNPTNGTWSATGNLHTTGGGSATLLPNGKVLFVGASTELYNPATGTWSLTGNPGHRGGSVTLLPNGKVLLAGADTNRAELYDPANGTWSLTGTPVTSRGGGYTATLLPNGKVLVAGGQPSRSNLALTNAELYNPTNGTWSATGGLSEPRWGQTATLLPNGKVLVSGGQDSNGLVVASAELYDPASGTWSFTGSLSNPRWGHTSNLLPNGKVLVVGGVGSVWVPFSAELYEPAPAFLNPITSPVRLGDGSFQFSFSNPSGPGYHILASLNAEAPLNIWSNLGPATESPPGSGQFQFTDHQAPNFPQRFYRVTSP